MKSFIMRGMYNHEKMKAPPPRLNSPRPSRSGVSASSAQCAGVSFPPSRAARSIQRQGSAGLALSFQGSVTFSL